MLVESALAGQMGFGFDVDPIARLVSKVKTTPLDERRLLSYQEQVTEYVSSTASGTFQPKIPTLPHWFSQQAIRDLSILRDAIDLFRSDADIYDFLLVVFLAIIRRSSNADNQTQKTYVSHTHPKTPEAAKPLFLTTLQDYVDRILEFGQLVRLMGGKGEVLGPWDARAFAELWQSRELPFADLAITSPPYVMTVDYVYNQMAEYFWIGDLFGLSTQDEQNEHKQMYIGTQKVSRTTYASEFRLGISSIDETIAFVSDKDTKNGYIIYKYFSDMKIHFSEMARILRPGAHYVMVIGDSIISGFPIETHTLIEQCATEVGFVQEHSFAYEIRNRHMRFPRAGRGGLVKYDWIVDFRLDR